MIDYQDRNSNKKFVADINLGRLAKWLRLLGYDTLFFKSCSLLALGNISRKENRIFLTRSSKNARKKIFERVILINSPNIFEQLKELSSELDYYPDRILTLCSTCNHELFQVDKEKVRGLVPDYVFKTNETFSTCRNCGRIYWKGTHNRAIIDKFAEIFGIDK